jgi:hypothetical protein
VIRPAASSVPNDGSARGDAASPYRLALDETVATIRRRARLYRVQAALILVIAVTAAIIAFAGRPPTSLSAALAAVAVFGVFRCADLWLLWQWERQIAARWAAGDLVFAFFRNVVEASRSLPQGTVGAMLNLLPKDEEIAGPSVPPDVRRALAATMRLTRNVDACADALRTLGRCALIISVGLAVAHRSWHPARLLGIPGVGLELLAWMVPRVAAARRRDRLVPLTRSGSRVPLTSRLGWRGLPRPRR